ncbi:hypothetical protein [Planococcus plakortidis]|uniref:hypothetical protein n=1 Tax=Planococcus plakortidis TaxID=1038856 RepID=UPI00385B69C6
MDGLHFTISGTPQSDISSMMENENPLLKVGLLYADKVKLSSMSSALMIDLTRMYTFDDSQKVQYMIEFLPNLLPDEQVRNTTHRKLVYIQNLMSKRKLKPQEKQELLQFRLQGLNQMWVGMKHMIEEMVVNTGMDNLLPFIENDILELEGLTAQDNSMDSLMNDWLNNLDNTLGNPNTYPLFDKTINSLVSQAQSVVSSLESGNTHISERATHAGFVSDVYQKLPSFERASFDEIMDIRKELQKPLINFRSAMLVYSQEINSVPWEENFEYEANKLYISKVLPAVTEVEESCEENKVLKKVLTRVVEDNVVRWSGGLGFGVASLTELSSLLYLNAVPVGMATLDGLKEWNAERGNTRKMQMYYYNALNQRLK